MTYSVALPECRLSALAGRVPIDVVRDGIFRNLGFASDPQESMLAFAAEEDFAVQLGSCPEVSCVLTTPALAGLFPAAIGLAACADPQADFYAIHEHLATRTDFYWSDFATEIGPGARVHPRAWIAEKNVRIGAHASIGPQASIGERTLIGADAVIHAGATLGAEGFQLARRGGKVLSMPHRGATRIGERAVVLANAVIASALFRQATVIGPDTRLGNLGFVSHNVRTGSSCFLGHGCVVNGNVAIGNRVWIGPNATIANNLVIGDDAYVCLGATVLGPVAPGECIHGLAVDHELSRKRR